MDSVICTPCDDQRSRRDKFNAVDSKIVALNVYKTIIINILL